MDIEELRNALGKFFSKSTGASIVHIAHTIKGYECDDEKKAIKLFVSGNYHKQLLDRQINTIYEFFEGVSKKDYRIDIVVSEEIKKAETEKQVKEQQERRQQQADLEKSASRTEKIATLRKVIQAQSRFSDAELALDFGYLIDSAETPFKSKIIRYSHSITSSENPLSSKGLFIFGWENGIGKSTTLKLLYNEFFRNDEFFDKVLFSDKAEPTLIFLNIQTVFLLLKQNFPLDSNAAYGNYNRQLNLLYNCPILMLDDLGMLKVSRWNLTILRNILDNRQNKLTFFSSNYSIDTLAPLWLKQIDYIKNKSEIEYQDTVKIIETIKSRILRKSTFLEIRGSSFDKVGRLN